jgi:hypothetical protein
MITYPAGIFINPTTCQSLKTGPMLKRQPGPPYEAGSAVGV